MGDCFLTLFYRNRRSYIDCISYRCQANGFSGFAKYAADCVRIKRRTGINGSMEKYGRLTVRRNPSSEL